MWKVMLKNQNGLNSLVIKYESNVKRNCVQKII